MLRLQRDGAAPPGGAGAPRARACGADTRLLAGFATLSVTTAFTHPLDTLRVRLAVDADLARAGAARALRAIVAREGWRALYRGFGPTLVGAGPRGALGFGVFETLKPLAAGTAWGGLRERPGLSKFCCGYVAGVVSEAFIYPLDTVRRRQQALGDRGGRPGPFYREIAAIAAREGVRGLYKGIAVNLIKSPVATAVSFAVNDSVKEALLRRGLV